MKKLAVFFIAMTLSSLVHATEIVYRVKEARGNDVQIENGLGFGFVSCNGWVFQGARGRYLSMYLDSQAGNQGEYSSGRAVRFAIPFGSERECLLARTAFLNRMVEIVMNLEGDEFTGDRPVLNLRGVNN
jgi:hypothetical protein